jgi:hypothetical protein
VALSVKEYQQQELRAFQMVVECIQAPQHWCLTRTLTVHKRIPLMFRKIKK